MRWGVALIVVLALAIPGVIAPGISAVGCFNVACSCFSDSICPADYGADCKSNGGLGDADCAGVQSCAVTTGCGYGGIEPGLGEVCDDGIGINGQPGSCCTTSCQFSAASTQCRAASGVCDAAEFCPGTSNSCPANGFLSAANSCAVPSTWSCVNQCTRQGSPTLCPGNGATCTGAAG